MENLNTNDLSVYLLKAVRKGKLVSHNLDSFEEFIGSNGIKNILCNMFILKDSIPYTDGQKHVHNNNEVDKTNYVLKFIDVEFNKNLTYIDPKTNDKKFLTPYICRTLNLSYSTEINVSCDLEVTHFYKNGNKHVENVIIKDLQIGKYPIMVKSSLCWLKDINKDELFCFSKEDPNDEGGYFILSGNEWTIDITENILFNSFRVYNNQYNNELTRGEIISQPGDGFEGSREIMLRLNKNGMITIQFIGGGDLEDLQIPFYLIY